MFLGCIYLTVKAVLSLTGVQRAEMKSLFTLGSRCANRSHRQRKIIANMRCEMLTAEVRFQIEPTNNTSYIIEAFSQYRLIYNFNIPVFSNMNITAKRKCRMPTLNLMNQNVKTCMGKSFQYFFRLLFHHYPILNVMTLLGSSSCSYSSASNISSVPLMKKEFSHPLMEFQNSVEQPSGSNRTMNAKYKRVESAAAIGSARCASVCLSSCSFSFIHEIIRSFIRFSQLLNRKVDYEKMIEGDSDSISYWSISCVRFLSFCKSLKLDYTSNMNCSLLLLLLLLPAFLLLDQFIFIIKSNAE
ncbi:hypothetical protein T05_2903 [Trichinella murrelli]|uniref:Uncharacterized protein n=1 Tax=Trichinella murrelli TaxID=144512 RepID=A0A0V0TH52_9BILA|nr:hypothetical protein T05_2903 [Trichinella murrelli]